MSWPYDGQPAPGRADDAARRGALRGIPRVPRGRPRPAVARPPRAWPPPRRGARGHRPRPRVPHLEVAHARAGPRRRPGGGPDVSDGQRGGEGLAALALLQAALNGDREHAAVPRTPEVLAGEG